MLSGYASVRKPGRQDELREKLVHSMVVPEAIATPAGVSEMHQSFRVVLN